MAAASLTVPEKEKNKNPQSAKIVMLPAPLKPVKAILCIGTGLPCPSAYFGDRAHNSFAFLNPYIGALTAYNLRAMMSQSRSSDADMPERLYPGITPRLLSMIQKNLTRKGGKTYDEATVERRALGIKGRPGPHHKFLAALELDLVSGPMVWKPEANDKPFLPVSMALAAGWSWSSILEELITLLDRAEAFIEEWGWHGKSLKVSGEGLHEKRQERRKKSSSEDEAVPMEDD